MAQTFIEKNLDKLLRILSAMNGKPSWLSLKGLTNLINTYDRSDSVLHSFIEFIKSEDQKNIDLLYDQTIRIHGPKPKL